MDEKNVNQGNEAEKLENEAPEVALDQETVSDENASDAGHCEGEKKSFFSKKQKQNGEKKANDELEALKKTVEETSDKYLRLAAEFDNFKKRTQKENDARYLDIKAETLKQILPVVDNFERALKTEAPDDAKAYAEGVKMIYDMLVKILTDNGVEAIDALNQPFDPEKHFAVMHVEDESFGENTVCEVFEKGYRMGDRVLRYSMVKVAN